VIITPDHHRLIRKAAKFMVDQPAPRFVIVGVDADDNLVLTPTHYPFSPHPVDRLADSISPNAVVLSRHRRRWGILVPTSDPKNRWELVTASWCYSYSSRHMRLTHASRVWLLANAPSELDLSLLQNPSPSDVWRRDIERNA
jgi:hypothetical protein